MEEGFRTEDVKEGKVVKERGSGEKRVSGKWQADIAKACDDRRSYNISTELLLVC